MVAFVTEDDYDDDQYTVMAFEIHHVSAMFQLLVNIVLKGIVCCEAYIYL